MSTKEWLLVLDKEILLKELENIPEPAMAEVLDFVRFIKAKAFRENFSTVLLSEQSLGKDWLRPEEDEAWSNL